MELHSYSRHRNHFDIDSKQTHSEEIQVIPKKRFWEVMKIFCFAFGENNVNYESVDDSADDSAADLADDNVDCESADDFADDTADDCDNE